jgi:hypothetical protein
MRIDRKFLAIFVGATLCDFLAGLLRWMHHTGFTQRFGWPFVIYIDLGNNFGTCFLSGALLGDLLVAFTLSVIIWAFWRFALSPEQRIMQKQIRSRTWGWIRLIYGAFLLFNSIRTTYQEIHGRFSPGYAPDNQTQFEGMMFANVVILAIVLWLIISGLRKITRTAPESPAETENS